MILSPFAIFLPFADRLAVALWTKVDRPPHDVPGVLHAEEVASAAHVHGARTVIVRGASHRISGADGMLTDKPGLALVTRSADCQSLVIYAPEKEILGILHVGWRGLIAGAIPACFAELRREWNVDAKDTFVGIGPSLCQKHSGFSAPVRELPTLSPQFIDAENTVDLRGAADAELFALGLPRDHLERSSHCTCCHPETYWTYRGGDREAVKEGQVNVLAAVMLPQ